MFLIAAIVLVAGCAGTQSSATNQQGGANYGASQITDTDVAVDSTQADLGLLSTEDVPPQTG